MADHSPKFEWIKSYYLRKCGDGSDPVKVQEAVAYLDRAVATGAITEAEKGEILWIINR